MTERNRRSERRTSSLANHQLQELGRAIKLLRTERGMERADLAESSGISYPYLSEIESGKKQPSTAALTAIAGALGMRPSELLEATEWSLRPRPASAALDRTSWFREESRIEAMSSLHVESATEDADARGIDELRGLFAVMTPSDREMVLDLARRLAEAGVSRDGDR